MRRHICSYRKRRHLPTAYRKAAEDSGEKSHRLSSERILCGALQWPSEKLEIVVML